MTVEELNIKISADAGEFSRGLAEAETSLEKFRSDAVKAGEEVTKAFDGLVNVGVNTVYNGENAHNSTVQPAETSPDKPSVSFPFVDWRSGGAVMPLTGGINVSSIFPAVSSHTAEVMQLEKSETVIGAASSGSDGDTRPVNITTTVELDGDRIGEAVNRFNMRRNRITNGIYG